VAVTGTGPAKPGASLAVDPRRVHDLELALARVRVQGLPGECQGASQMSCGESTLRPVRKSRVLPTAPLKAQPAAAWLKSLTAAVFEPVTSPGLRD
jgi:hypothetical protein